MTVIYATNKYSNEGQNLNSLEYQIMIVFHLRKPGLQNINLVDVFKHSACKWYGNYVHNGLDGQFYGRIVD